MKIFFIGTVEFSLQALEKLISMHANIVGVATKAASAFNADFADLTPVCEKNNIPHKKVNDINHTNNIAFIKNCSPDVIFCFGWSSLIKKEILELTRLGVIGFHPAALPHNRGRHPIIWALALGLEKTASTFFFIDEGADTGDILSQVEVPVLFSDNAATLYKKITGTALNQIADFTLQLQQLSFKRIKQHIGEGNVWRKRNKDDGRIDFRMSSIAIYNLVRALTKPYTGAHIATSNGDIKVWEIKINQEIQRNIEYGKVLSVEEEKIKVKTFDGAIWITNHEFKVLPKEGEYL